MPSSKELTVTDHCPFCNSFHVWCDPIGPAPKAWQWECVTKIDRKTGEFLRGKDCKLFELTARVAALEGELEAERNESQGLRDAWATVMANDTPWPLGDVLTTLADAVDHLRTAHDCDHHGYEIQIVCRDRARSVAAAIKSALAPQEPQ